MQSSNVCYLHLEASRSTKLTHLLPRSAVTSFFAAHIAPLNPIILPSRVMDYHSLPSPLLFSIMGVAALHRSVPLSVFLPVRRRLDELLEKENVEHYSTLNNIQTLGICCMSHEMHVGLLTVTVV